ncbi:hypothetical protein KXV85_004728, partial [Aspergillus fumigatus]
MSFNFMGMYFHSHVRRKLANEHGVDGIRLSPRELECLEWASQGKSAWEIGRILGISRNTVASYLENAKEKLGVRRTPPTTKGDASNQRFRSKRRDDTVGGNMIQLITPPSYGELERVPWRGGAGGGSPRSPARAGP